MRKFELTSAPGLLALVLTATFASIDWIMSLEPEWFSTIYGLLILMGWVLAGFSIVIATTVALARREPFAEMVSDEHLHDLGKLLFAFVLVWAYFAFSQFLIIWSGNLPEEIPFYLRRLQGGWQVVALTVVLMHFVLPFLMLLPMATKRNMRLLFRVTAVILLMRLVDGHWMASAASRGSASAASWLDLAVPVAVGGLWLWSFASNLGKHPLLPLGDPGLQEALAHGDE